MQPGILNQLVASINGIPINAFRKHLPRKFRQTFVCLGFKFKTYVAAMFESFSLIFPYWTSRGSRTALNSFSILCESHNEAGFARKGISEIKQKEFSGALYLVRGSGCHLTSSGEMVPGSLTL